MVGFGAPACVLPVKEREIEPINDLDDKAGQMVLSEPVIYRGRQQIVSLAVGDDEVGHGVRYSAT